MSEAPITDLSDDLGSTNQYREQGDDREHGNHPELHSSGQGSSAAEAGCRAQHLASPYATMPVACGMYSLVFDAAFWVKPDDSARALRAMTLRSRPQLAGNFLGKSMACASMQAQLYASMQVSFACHHRPWKVGEWV